MNGDFAYRNLRDRGKRQDDLFCYLDLVRLRTMLNRLAAVEPDAAPAAVLRKIVAASGPFQSAALFPVPRLCCRVAIVDQKGIQAVLEKILAGLPVHTETVAGVPVTSIMLVGGLIQPSYAMVDGFLVIADSRQQIDAILQSGHDTLVRDAWFKKVNVGLTAPNNLVVFSRNAKMLDGLKELVSWAGTVVVFRDARAGAKSKVLPDQVVLPVPDGLQMNMATGFREFNTGSELIMESAVLREK